MVSSAYKRTKERYLVAVRELWEPQAFPELLLAAPVVPFPRIGSSWGEVLMGRLEIIEEIYDRTDPGGSPRLLSN